MDPEKIMDGLAEELTNALKTMSQAKTVEEKVAYSQVIKNLCESLGVFLDAAGNALAYEDYDEDED